MNATPGKLYLGCPVWGTETWKGKLYTGRAARRDWLNQYSAVFQTVEGNSTFYALPTLETAARWAESVAPGFRFSLKVSRSISHELRLRGAERELAAFVAVAEVLASHDCLGPSFLQMPPEFSPQDSSVLESFLRTLPKHLPWALEVRHPAWYDWSTHEQSLDMLLRELNIDKVLFDSRPLYSKPPSDDSERAAQKAKPRTPHRTTITAAHPLLRFIGRNNVDEVQPWIAEWSVVIANWLTQGLQPFVFTHAPDDRYAPEFARALHVAIGKHFEKLPAMAAWPGEVEKQGSVKQLELF